MSEKRRVPFVSGSETSKAAAESLTDAVLGHQERQVMAAFRMVGAGERDQLRMF
jgi:hypothetical protein